MKILHSSNNTSAFNIKSINDEYLGGNMLAVYGQLANGTYFYGTDADYFMWIVDADPKVIFDMEDDDWFDWLDEHSVKDISEDDATKLWIKLFQYCKKNNIQLSGYDIDKYPEAIDYLKEN